MTKDCYFILKYFVTLYVFLNKSNYLYLYGDNLHIIIIVSYCEIHRLTEVNGRALWFAYVKHDYVTLVTLSLLHSP